MPDSSPDLEFARGTRDRGTRGRGTPPKGAKIRGVRGGRIGRQEIPNGEFDTIAKQIEEVDQDLDLAQPGSDSWISLIDKKKTLLEQAWGVWPLLANDVAILAFCIITETNRISEMRYIGGTIMNRVLDKYRGTTIKSVVLSRSQYSRFNGNVPERRAVSAPDPEKAIRELIAKDWRYSTNLYESARDVARRLIGGRDNPWRDGTVRHPRAARAHHYYSPISMKPKGKKPAWFDAKREVDVAGIDKSRFRWFHDIP